MGYGQTKTLLIARTTGTKILEDGKKINTFGFAQKLAENPGIPGPTLVYYEGDSVTLDMWNISQNMPHTIHLHGLDVDQQNDGVPHLSFEVGHMEHGIYRFKAPHPGTYFYHCHVVSAVHVQAGMFGLIIIKPKGENNMTWEGGYKYLLEYSFLFSEIDTVWHQDSILEHKHPGNVSLPDWDPSYFLCNGMSGIQLDTSEKPHFSINAASFIRFSNMGYSGNRVIMPSGLKAQIISSDGRPLPVPLNRDTLHVFPGERYGVLVRPSQISEDTIRVEYLDMNTMNVIGNQKLAFSTSDWVSADAYNPQEVILYPIPSTGVIDIKGFGPAIHDAKVSTTSGKIIPVAFQNIGSSSARITFPKDLVPGPYILTMRIGNQKYSRRVLMTN
jgi:FtsP/CotA-like multicopper oxidase with cupredoxin domain